MFHLIFIFLLNIIYTLKTSPNDYKELDNPYENDITENTEAYHHIITSFAAKGYIDYYKGIYYKQYLCCSWGYTRYLHYRCLNKKGSYETIENYTLLNNINDTNLKELLHYGCTPQEEEGHLNILFDYERYASDSIVSLQIRMTNLDPEDVEFTLSVCTGTKGSYEDTKCNAFQNLDTYIIPNNSFIIYTFKLDETSYYVQSDNFQTPRNDVTFNFNKPILLYINPVDKDKKIYINSYIVSVNLRRYVLSLGGHAHNYCNNYGCVSSYTCSATSSYDLKYGCVIPNYGDDLITDCSLNGCIPGSYCKSGENTCLECDYQCRTCEGGYMNCISCYSNAVYPQWKYYRDVTYKTGKCTFEFYPLNKVESIDINVPIPLSYRVSFEFWIYIHDPTYLTNQDLTSSLSSFILKDFLTLSLHQNVSDYSSAVLILTPFEYFYPFKHDFTIMDDYYSRYLKSYPALQYLKLEVKDITSKWFYVRAGLSYTHNKIFINDQEKVLKFIPVFKDDEVTNYHFLMRKFYRRYDSTTLKVQGFQYINTDVYVRNLNFYSEYMFNEMNNPNYFNLHEINDILTYPQLLFSVPFTDVTVESMKLQVKFNFYDYSGQLNDASSSSEQNSVIITQLQGKLVRDYLAPTKNFYRLNLLSFANKEYYSSDIQRDNYIDIECLSEENKKYCYDDGQPYICKNGFNLIEKIKDLNETIGNTNTPEQGNDNTGNDPADISIESTIIYEEPRQNYSFCVSECVQEDSEGNRHEFMRLPNIKRNQKTKTKIDNDICAYECNSSLVENCPISQNINIKDFKCRENESVYSYFYQCFDSKEFPTQESALQFSGTMNTKSIYFPLNQDLYNFYIEIWFHPDLLTQEDKPLYTKYFFATNNHHMYYDIKTQQFTLKVYNIKGTASTFNLNQKIYYSGWNHLIFYSHENIVKGSILTTFTVSLANNMLDIGTIDGRSTANKICFCNGDLNCCERLSGVTWFDMFIKEIKVWDSRFAQYYTLNDYDKYSFIIPGGLLQMYNLTAAAIDQNKIIDSRHPDDSSYNAIFPYDDEEINPDNDMNYNIGWNFNWNDLNYPKYIVSSKILRDYARVEISDVNTCNEGCKKCFGYNKFSCYSCQPGYALNGATCTKTSDDVGIYYYVNPLKPLNETDNLQDLELNFASLNLSQYSTITLHFYIKIYGFVQEQIDLYLNEGKELFKLITFSEEKQFILYYNIKTDIISLYLGNDIQFSYKGVIAKFGSWIPLSISAFRSDDLDFRKNFASMTFDNTLLPYKGLNNSGLYEYFPIETFKISKYLIAHFADVTLYDLFIINAFGYAQHKYIQNGKFSETSDISRNKIIIKTFKMFYTDKDPDIDYQNLTLTYGVNISNINRCISPEDVLNPNETMQKVTCKEDYLPYLDQKCKDDEFVNFQTSNLPSTCIPSASKCENIEQVTINMLTNCDYLYATCDTKSLNSINNLIYSYSPKNSPNDHYIICGNAHGLDLARFEPGEIKNITSPTNEFKIEFWFLSQSYVNNHFNSIIMEWTDHIKIEVFYNKESGKYGAKCIPMNDEENMMEFEYIEASDDQNRWRYIVCGVNVEKKQAYMTNLMVENRAEVTFNPSIELTNELTTLKIQENSETNYGVTYLKELRLWECYDCSSDKAFVKYSRDDPYFAKVLHYFQFESPTGFLQDYHQGFPEPYVYVQLITKEDFTGYGLLESIPDVPDCNEGGQLYFSVKMGEGCDTMFNFNIFKKDVVFENIPASKANRYTMEFWFYVESADDFREGLNLIYEDHMTISSQVHNIDDTDLDVYCFPQAYRDHLDDVFGEKLYQRYKETQNKAGYTYVNGLSQWNYVRCAYSFDLLKYYINDETPKSIEPEIYFESYENDKPFKMFMKNLVKLKINLSKDNFARTIIQTINIYRDYIPQSIQTKYVQMDQYITNIFENPYYPIAFSVSFPDNYDIITDKLKYYVSDYDIYPETDSLEHFLGDIELKSYKTYPIYSPFKQCGYGQIYVPEKLSCRSIMTPNTCDKVKTFCIDNNKFFWCPYGKYLDVNELKCDKDCPEGYTRPPDIRDGYGMCYINAAEKHYSKYPRFNADLKKGFYETKFECEDGYTLVNYNCIPNDKISTSGLYFSSKYKFSNLIASYNKLSVPITNYYVDFWFLFDLSGEYRFNIPDDNNRYTIFIAYPHFITRYKGKIQYNNGYILLDYYDVISVDEIKYKWNHVVIENYQIDGKTAADTFKYLNIYWNNDYNNPKFSLKINNANSYALSQIAFCHEDNDEYSICNLGLNAMTYKVFAPLWDDAYYKDIKVWNRNATSISSINTFGSPLNNEITMNIISYHSLNVDSIKPGIVKSLVTFMGSDVDFKVGYNLEKPYDNSQQINWVTDFDITLPDKYIDSLNVSCYTDEVNSPHFSREDATFIAKECEGRCQQCFSNSEEDCISCKTPYLISATKCTDVTGFYFKVPSLDKNLDVITLNHDLSSYKEITITFYMKFLGSIEQRSGIVPIIYFYQNRNYFGWDIAKQTFTIDLIDESAKSQTIFSYNQSRLFIGKWCLVSISIYASEYQLIFPNMIQFMIDENIIQPEIDLVQLHKTIINYDYISINNKMSAVFYDLRIYNKFLIGAYGIGQDIYNSQLGTSLLKARFKFKSEDESSHDCAQPSEINPSLGNNLQCIGDNNPYDDPNLTCESGEYKIVDAINNIIECNTCDNYCDIKYCTSNTTKNCSCINDGPNYWLRYDFNEEKQKFYCEKLDSININEYNDIVIENIGVGTETGYMIEFWFYLETYMDRANFKGVSIIWKHFLKIVVEHYQNNLIQINCYPCSDNNGDYISEKDDKYNTWVFYRCQMDKEKNKIYSQRKTNPVSKSNLYSGSVTSTTLTIKDNSNKPYGVFLLRELRIYNARNTILNEISHVNLDITKYISLIHYYKCNFTDTASPRNILYDSVKDLNIELTYKLEKYPYSYISQDYTELVFCEEGFEYKMNTEGNYECQEIDQNDILDRLSKDDSTYTVSDLVSKVDNIFNMAVGEVNITEEKIIISNFSYDENGTISSKDPVFSDSYCSNKGQAKLVLTTVACYCLGDSFGKYCHLKGSDYTALETMYELFFNKAQKTYVKYVSESMNENSEEEYAFLSSLNNLILGNQLYAKDGSFITEVTYWLEKDVIKNVDHCDLKYIEMIDNIFSTLILLTNTYKAGLISNHKGTDRDADLNLGQEEEIDGNILLIKKHLEYLTKLCFSDTVDGLWSYYSPNIKVDLLKIPKNGDIDIDEKIKSLKIGNHEPYVQFGSCLNSIKSIDNSQYINIQIITWIYSPWYHHHILNYNYSSNYIEVKVYSDNLNELKLNECKDDSSISFYLTLTNPFMTDIINNNKFHFKEGNIYKSDDPIFTEPKYILEDGSVSTMSLQERRDTYYFRYLLVFKTYDEGNRELVTNDVSYNNLEDDSYLKCSSKHLSDFMLNYEYNPEPNIILGRFYFLKHFKLFTNSKNLSGNYGFYSIILVIALYFINFFIVKMCLLIKKKRLGNKNYLVIEDFLMDYVYPYGNIEGDFFVNKENMNKIYNNNLDLKKEKEKIKENKLMKLRENKNFETEGKLMNEKNIHQSLRKNAYLNENNLMNYGDIKNKKLYEQYYQEINEEGYNTDELEEELEKNDVNKKGRNKKAKKETISVNSKEDLNVEEMKTEIKKNKKRKKNNFALKEDKKDMEEIEEEMNEVKDFNRRNKVNINHLIHSLQISNENLRVRILSKMKVNICKFFCVNLKNRIIFINTFTGNYTYSASIKALCFPLYLEILLFVNTFIFITLEDESNFLDYIQNNIGDFLWRCLLPIILVKVYFYSTRYFYNIENGKVRNLLYEFKTNRKSFDKHYFNLLKKVRNMMIFETILFFLMAALTYIFVFALFAVYPSQGKTMFVSLICGIAIDLLLNFVLELLMAILFICRKNHVIVVILDYANRLLSYKMLSP